MAALQESVVKAQASRGDVREADVRDLPPARKTAKKPAKKTAKKASRRSRSA
ncbi:hypothetical protein [Streptomyces avermitilis]|uniref:hypothetical protein n=1 Tax=Streptomyces avermitilis TaxID=33903 RepID=UPI0036956708